MPKGVYAGSFDPVTLGHMWIIDQGSKLFEQLVVAIGTNPEKKYTFSVKERVAMLQECLGKYENVVVDVFENQFLVNYADSIDAAYILRGIRTENDYQYERGMRYINGDLNPKIETIFLIPPREIVEVSSNFVKGLVGPKGWKEIVSKYLPKPVYQRFLDKLDES